MESLLDKIQQPNDIKKIGQEEYDLLASHIRRFLVQKISKTGGHLASNLGVVELTMALHLILDFPEDKLIWDVGHQAYTHKLLTGRKEEFDTLRQYDGMSGFPKRKESNCDAFDTGHSSTSISVATGLIRAQELNGEKKKVVAVIGDGALSGGMAYEALNNAGRLKTNLMIVLNDNKMSISENVGGMANYLGRIRTNIHYTDFKGDLEAKLSSIPYVGERVVQRLKRSKDSIKHFFVPGMLFENMGITYIGPIYGHNIGLMLEAFEAASRLNHAVLVHIVTKKGKGYRKAESNPSLFHGIGPFDYRSGLITEEKKGKSYTEIFSETMLDLAMKHKNVVAISAAMPEGTGLAAFQKKFPNRFFDVGIAEEHAVTFAAGLAASGFRPVVAIYSTFLQRAYDQIIHDVSIGKFPVIFAIDRAGIVGNDGETHQGIFDISFLSHIPGMILMAPKNGLELREMLEFAVACNAPVAIRYPRGIACQQFVEFHEPIVLGKSEVLIEDSRDIALLAVGNMVEIASKVREMLVTKGRRVTLINVRFLNPIDIELLHHLAKTHPFLVTLEENVKLGGFGSQVASFLCDHRYRDSSLLNISLPGEFIPQGTQKQLRKQYGLDTESVFDKINEFIGFENHC